VRLTLDTNTVVSGLLWEGAPSRLIRAALDGQVSLVTSRVLLLELADVLGRAKFASRVAASGFSVTELVARYAVLAESVESATITPMASDPDDDEVLACALGGRADLVVSGDAGLLNLARYQEIEIVDPAVALERIRRERRSD
jgi:putative PIN family toxin of toxin-antitoxin system